MQDRIIYAVFLCIYAAGMVLLGSFDMRIPGRIAGRNLRIGGRDQFGVKLKKAFYRAGIVENYYNSRVSREIYDGLSFLRNLAMYGTENMLSADAVIEKLSHKKGVLRKVYGDMLALVRVGKTEEARRCISRFAKAPFAAEYVGLLVGWDNGNPADMKEIIFSYQKSIRESNATENRKKAEVVSDLLYVPAVINVIVIFINFIYVGYLSEQKEMLKMLF